VTPFASEASEVPDLPAAVIYRKWLPRGGEYGL